MLTPYWATCKFIWRLQPALEASSRAPTAQTHHSEGRGKKYSTTSTPKQFLDSSSESFLHQRQGGMGRWRQEGKAGKSQSL